MVARVGGRPRRRLDARRRAAQLALHHRVVEVIGARALLDAVLLDAPCSASGVIRRHPDVKLLRRESDIAQLAVRQRGILRGLWPLLKVGGALLYVTCSILDEENSQVVQCFLAEQEDAQLSCANMSWGETTDCGRQLLPSTGGPDGLFYALLRKTG